MKYNKYSQKIKYEFNKGSKMKGYKVVNYDKWTSLPEIFSTLKEAKEAKKTSNLGKNTIIEYFNSRNDRAKRIFS